MSLLKAYEQMTKEAAEQEIMKERVAVIEKYASFAEDELAKAYPNNYTKEDVAQLADAMIQHDIAIEEQQEKIAELDEAGRIMARAFYAESQSLEAKK